MNFDPKKLDFYPKEAGVYLMKDQKHRVLYVGKANNLKVRLKQYFTTGRDTRKMIPYLLTQVFQIDTIIVSSEKEALLLENTLIKTHKPKYNVLLKDDKTFVSLVLTHHKWPMLKLVRYKGKPKSLGRYFGPYTNAKAARQTLDLILKLFPLRQCSDQELASRARPCLLYDIKKCVAPCVNKCTQQEYSIHVNNTKDLLLGKDKQVLTTLRKQMEHHSKSLEFEKANELYQMIQQIEHVLQVQHVDNPTAKDVDAIGLYRNTDAVMIVCLLFRKGKLIGSEHYSFHQIIDEDEEVITQFLLQHYQTASIPSEILIPVTVQEQMPLQELLSEQAKQTIKLRHPKKGDKAQLVKLAHQNAKSLFLRQEDERSLKEKILLDLQDMLKLVRFPRRIECFDTSNISGTDPVASMVCYINGKYDSSKTRLFKLKTSPKSDDYQATAEVLQRHLLRKKQENDFCDLLIVDGGKGHLKIAMNILKELNIVNIDLIGVAKQQSKHTKGMTEEKIYLPYEKEPICIHARSPLLHLLQKMRDEAHRVAIQYHKKRRSKTSFTSLLDTIEGIGPIKKKRLLQHFKSTKKILEATEEELKQVKGITQKDIDHLKNI